MNSRRMIFLSHFLILSRGIVLIQPTSAQINFKIKNTVIWIILNTIVKLKYRMFKNQNRQFLSEILNNFRS